MKQIIKGFFFLLSSLGFSVMIIGLFFNFIDWATVGFLVMWFAMYFLLKLEEEIKCQNLKRETK